MQDESESCDNVLEKFYEDEHYNYYFNCTKSDKVYAVINDKDKYLVKDLLNNNPTDYHITIDTFVDAGLDLKKESKYEQIVIGGKGNVSHSVKIKDDSILKIDSGDCIIDESKNSITFNIKFFIIPIKPGNTEVEIKFLDEETKKVNLIKRYMIDVKNNLDVHYEEIH